MIAAIYARKSTEQTGVADEQKSVARQVAHARQYAIHKGWTVAEDHVYVDDGISGAEFKSRPGFLRLMNALKPRPPFHVLIMSEESRLGREAIETAYALKQLVTAGVRVFFYLEDRERTLDTPTDKIMLSLTAFADELEREKARQRTYDAMLRRARAGQVTGGACFGYRNVEILGPGGKRSHVTREVEPGEAAVIVSIFERCASGSGLTTIAKQLNDEHALSPRAQQGRPGGWAPSSVREVLHRPLYRGELVWNRTRKRNTWGVKACADRPSADWIRLPVPELRIVSDDLWSRAHHRLADARSAYLRGTRGHLHGRPIHGSESKYLLTGFVRCAVCGGGFCVRSRSHGSTRAYLYACTSYHKRGRAICGNHLEASMMVADGEVLQSLRRYVLDPEVVDRSLHLAIRSLQTSLNQPAPDVAPLRAELEQVNLELARLVDAIAAGGDLPSMLAAVNAREDRRRELLAALDAIRHREAAVRFDLSAVAAEVQGYVDEWRNVLGAQVPDARRILRRLLKQPVTFMPRPDEGIYTFQGVASLGELLAGTIRPTSVASPTGLSQLVFFEGPLAA